MEQNKKKIFISHIADEHAEAEQAKEFLEKTFGNNIEVFLASSWESIPPGDDWFKRIEGAITAADLMLVFASTEAISRPWILFEAGAAWISKKKIIPVCHKGMIPAALPEPLRRLQAVDINAQNPAESLSKLVEAVRVSANLPVPTPFALEELPVDTGKIGATSLRGWMIRPSAHVGESIEGVFKVGLVDVCDASRASEADLNPDDSLYVRLYVESGVSELTYLNAIATGKVAQLFEPEEILGKTVNAKLKMKATHITGGGIGGGPRLVPLIVIESAKFSGAK